MLRCGVSRHVELDGSLERWLDGLAVVTPFSDSQSLWRALEDGDLDLTIVSRDAEDDATPAWVAKVRGLPTRPDVVVVTQREDARERSAYLAAGCLGVLNASLEADAIEAALRGLVLRAREGRSTGQSAPGVEYRLCDYVTRSEPMRHFLRLALRVARTDATALLLGETGVGKGLLARAIHNESLRRSGPFVAVDCGALVDTLLESELFGHERGAFTGAHRTRRGHFELAGGGTLFLDEISNLPLPLQTRLLSVLEDRSVRPVGSERVRPVDVRVIAATNRDLKGEVLAGRFREDLFYRLNVMTLLLPPLRERRADVAELIQSYLEHFAERLRVPVRTVEPEAVQALEAYDWPGNLRELRNVMERAVLLASGERIGLADLPQEFSARAEPGPVPHHDSEREAWLELPWQEARRRFLDDAERRYLVRALERSGGRVGEAAAFARIDPRSLHEKMRRHGLRKESFRSAR